MKILDTNQYISERIKVQPVTNAELDKIEKDIYLHEPQLKQGDIVYFQTRPYIPYMVILDESLFKKVMLSASIKGYNCTQGVFLNTSYEKCNPSFIIISDYDSSLKHKNNNSNWDIAKVYRGYLDTIRPEDMNKLIVLDNLNKLVKNFKLVFDNGKWL